MRSLRALPALLFVATLFFTGCSKDGESQRGEKKAEGNAGPAAKEERNAKKAAAPEKPRVMLSEQAVATARILVEPVRREPGSAPGGSLEVPGQIAFDPTRVAVISSRIPGRIERLAASQGDRVRAGQPVAYLSSPEFVAAQSDFIAATRRVATLAGTADEAGARALASAAGQRLLLLGASAELVAKLDSEGEPSLWLPLTAPFAGSIVEAPGIVGTAVVPGDAIFRIADLSVVNVSANVPEASLAVVREGQSASVHVAAFPAAGFAGRVVRLGDELDPTTRTVKAILRVENRDRLLRAGMFATVRLALPEGATVAGAEGPGFLTLPESAVVTDGEDRFVFVEAAPRTFERRAVETAPLVPPGGVSPIGGRVVVRSGLAEGERVVVRGAFTLKSELAKSRLGEQGE